MITSQCGEGAAGCVPAPLYLPLYCIPGAADDEKIIKAHYPDLDQKLIDAGWTPSTGVRDLRGLQRSRGTSEVLDRGFRRWGGIGGVPLEKLEKEIRCGGTFKKDRGLKLVEITDMFTDFLYLLRSYGMKTSLNEWNSLMEALEMNRTTRA